MKKIIEGIKYWGQLLLLPIYWFSFLFPRKKNIWLFGSTFGRRFADNPRYAYLYINQFHKEDVRAIWISHNREVVEMLQKEGLEAYYYHSLKGIFYCLFAEVYIYDNYSKDISFWLSGGATKINLWHGTATKKINQDNIFDYYRNPRTKWEAFKGIPRRLSDEKPGHYVLATSKQMAPILAGAFHTSMSHTLVVGHPRNDILLRDDLQDIYTVQECETRRQLEDFHREGKKLLYYVPTFRDSERKFFDVMDLQEFDRFLADRSYILCTKLHIKSKLKADFEQIGYKNIYNIDADVDPATILPYCDFMIADYSSIYLDYMFLERPAVAFPFDYEEYVTESRECYFDYDDYMPEQKVYSMSELIAAIDGIFKDDVCKEQRKVRRAFHFDDIDGNSSERLYQKVWEIKK